MMEGRMRQTTVLGQIEQYALYGHWDRRTQLVGGGIREELTRLFGVKIRVGRSTRGCPDLRL